MSRTPNTPAAPADMPELVPTKVAELVAMQNAAPSQGDMDAVLAAGIDLGRIEAMDFVATVATSAIIQIYENVKKSKAWSFLRNPKSSDGSNFQSLDEFCTVKLGKSYKRLQDITLNRSLIGQEAFEQAERLGLRQRDYNAIKSLPAPDQELVRRAVEEAQSREEVLSLLQELAAKHGKERAELTQALNEERLERAATQDLLDKKNKRIDTLEAERKKLSRAPANEQHKALKAEASNVATEARALIFGPLAQAVQLLTSTHNDALFAAALLGEVQRELTLLRDAHGLPDVSSAQELQQAADVAAWGNDNTAA